MERVRKSRCHALRGLAVVLVAAVLSAVGDGRAEEATPAQRNDWNADTRSVLPKLAAPPVIDGVINDQEWAGAAGFNAQVSQSDAHVLYPRAVAWYVAWDDENLYVASRTPLLKNERPKRKARSRIGQTIMMDDSVELWIDPKGRNAGPQVASHFQGIVTSLGITYHSRLFPKIGARTSAHDPAWQVGARADAKHMDVEVRMPVKGFDQPRPNRPGDVWGMMLARNFMAHAWNQSPLAYAMPNFGFGVETYYPRMTLGDGKCFVRFRSPVRGLYTGKAFADAEIVNPTGRARKVRVRLNVRDAAKQARFDSAQTLTVPARGRVQLKVDRPADPPIDPPASAVYRYAFDVSADDGTELFHTHFTYNPTYDRSRLDLEFEPEPELGASASFNPVRFLLEPEVDVIDFPRRDEAIAARTVVRDAAGKVLAKSRTGNKNMHMFRDLMQLPELAPGTYSWEATVIFADGTEAKAGEGAIEKKDEAKSFPWWNTKIGNAEKVLRPFTPVTAEKGGRVLKAWGKELHLDGLALPKQVLVTGNTDKWPRGRSGTPEVLAEPIALYAAIDGGQAVRVEAPGKPEVVSTADHRIALRGKAAAGPLRVTTETRWEQDGTYFVDLTLAPGKPDRPVKVNSLDLQIPVRSAVATFLNAYGLTGHGGGYFLDFVPDKPLGGREATGRFKVWDPSL
ncbi:MAG TPA: glycoside hydrolase domain-containing protein, partial [Phycisphaerae bacterium]|nr:glycoside hydrolase domain-containing protein [Phycisphaerae bacterium]